MNEQAWRLVAKQIGLVVIKLWLQEFERQLNIELEAKVVKPLPIPPSVAKPAQEEL